MKHTETLKPLSYSDFTGFEDKFKDDQATENTMKFIEAENEQLRMFVWFRSHIFNFRTVASSCKPEEILSVPKEIWWLFAYIKETLTREAHALSTGEEDPVMFRTRVRNFKVSLFIRVSTARSDWCESIGCYLKFWESITVYIRTFSGILHCTSEIASCKNHFLNRNPIACDAARNRNDSVLPWKRL